MGCPQRRPRGDKQLAVVEADRDLLQFNVRLAKNRQALLDTNRIERKAFREHARIENAVTAYTRELAALLDERGFSHPLVVSEPPLDWPGGTGVLDAATVEGWLDWPDAAEWIYFVCGPIAMMDQVERTLIAKGVPPARIMSERFQYD